ncbi:MAG TPA: hypothetical protein ENH10_00920 [Bacteroidetes bacterium]|nr:hypothetical protein BMS3Bbin04_01494 [bacterium BMS3Bbin04]HDO64581.1 hypothetical protein [Bacteroidota bacterium]HEX03706.1 hypothetical protein [Bacteroidota bacterium]
MHDPLADILGDDAYGTTRSFQVLDQLFSTGHHGPLAAACEVFLKRLTLLEMVLEEKGISVSEDELTAFLEQHHHEVDEETHKLAQLFFGKVASREGG